MCTYETSAWQWLVTGGQPEETPRCWSREGKGGAEVRREGGGRWVKRSEERPIRVYGVVNVFGVRLEDSSHAAASLAARCRGVGLAG